MDELHDGQDGAQATPVWAIFSDLMAALVGIFVLLLVFSIIFIRFSPRDAG